VRSAKYIIIILFSFVLLKGKTQQISGTFDFKQVQKKSIRVFDHAKVFSDDDTDNKAGLRRKIRLKGTEVSVPHIETMSFGQRSYKTIVFPLLLKEVHSSFVCHANHMRGPPVI